MKNAIYVLLALVVLSLINLTVEKRKLVELQIERTQLEIKILKGECKSERN